MKKKKNLESKSETIKRIGSDFIKEIEEIKDYLQNERGIKVSLPKLTDKITKHLEFIKIKSDLKNYAWKNDEQ